MRLNKTFLDRFKSYDFSRIKEEKIFLVGSITKAKTYFIKLESILQINHNKLVSVCSIDGIMNKNKFTEDEWQKLQKIALKKLMEQEAILVLDIGGYIGQQSKEEIEYFGEKLKRPVYYLSQLRDETKK